MLLQNSLIRESFFTMGTLEWFKFFMYTFDMISQSTFVTTFVAAVDAIKGV